MPSEQYFDEDGTSYWEVSLGDDTDCDTCGMSWNSLELVTEADGQWTASLRYGCYGGLTVSSSDPHLDEQLRELFFLLSDFSKWTAEDEKTLRELTRSL
jgi:hypothetical protein